ncbi:MAG: nucleotidyltransferase domain-containing protein [Methanoregula sp.]
MDTVLSRIIDVIVRTLDPDTIILFGSRARGDAREDSDFDICILKKGISGRRTIARTLYRALWSWCPGRTDYRYSCHVKKIQG